MKMLLKNGHLIDRLSPLNNQIVDILIHDDYIEKIAPSIVEIVDKEIDLKNQFISAGWVDMHVHCFNEKTDISVDADIVGVEQGVVCVVDAGSSGEANINEFYDQVKGHKTIVKALINIASSGLINRHELKDKNNVNIEKTLTRINEYNDFIVGVKLRASASVMGEDTKTPFEWANEVSIRSGLPMVVHFGNYPPSIDEILHQLKKGDVLTHSFHGKPNGVLENGKIRQLVRDKREQGVIFDVGHGESSFSYNVCKLAKDDGFDADCISTDLHKYSIDTPVVSLANVATKFLELGYSLDQVIEWITYAPSKIMHIDNEFGTISENRKAHLTIFKTLDKNETLVDSQGEKIEVSKVIQPTMCFINGKMELVDYE